MVRWLRRKGNSTPGAAHFPVDRLADYGLVAPGIVLNKDGSFQRTARFRGPDLDSATQGELAATSARLNNGSATAGLRLGVVRRR